MDVPLHTLFDLLIVGHGTTYHVNSILEQPGSFGETTSMKCLSVCTKHGRRSFQSLTGGTIQDYYSGHRVGPEKLQLLNCPQQDFLMADQEQLCLSWIMCRKFYKDQYIPSWSGYNICIRSSEVILESSLSYFECINTRATDISTINEMLEQALKMKASLNIKSIVCVFDQSIFAKAMEIKWKEPRKSHDCLIMLGTFHIIMMFMAVIYKWFKDAGLRDLIIQLGLLAEGSVDQVLSGKMYNRGVRVYKLMYGALFSLFLDAMEDFHKDDCWNSYFIEDGKTRVEDLAKNVSKIKFDQLCESEEFKTF